MQCVMCYLDAADAHRLDVLLRSNVDEVIDRYATDAA